MMLGLWNTTRANKENIFYAIVTIFLLERVRTGWNKTASRGRRSGADAATIAARQDRLVVKAALLYALPFLIPVVKYIYRSIAELSMAVPGLSVMQNTWVFFAVVVAAELFLALVIYNLLRIYIDRMNAAIGLFAKIGRNIWDGSKNAVQMSGDLGTRAARGVRGLAVTAVSKTRSLGAASSRFVKRAPSVILVQTRRRLRLRRRVRRLLGQTT
jgi:hypothetical protein